MRRIIFYLFYDSQGIVDDYIPHKLRALREHAEHIFVVSNSDLTVEGRARLEEVADTVWCRKNVGFDVWGYKEAMETFGMDRLADYDELILMNYTFFAPIFPFSETFEKMDGQELDFWGVTAHKAVDPHPFPGQTGVLPMHIQSHWIAVRKQMFTSHEFRSYWADMPMITSYEQSITQHESKFTQHFAEKGFTYAITFAPENYPTDHPVFESAAMMIDDRSPILKRRMFFHEPTYLERNAILGKRVMEKIESQTDYPADLIWKNVVRSAEPRTLYTNFSMLDVVNEVETGPEPTTAPRIAVMAHMYYDDMVDEVMGYIKHVPAPYDLIVTTISEEKKANIERALAAYDIARVDVRVMDENRGRDMAALLITCKDVLTSGDYDLICRIHSKKSPQNSYNTAKLFKDHMFDNLLYSDGYVKNIVKMFDEQKSLGMVFPPIVNIGYPTLGHSWFTNRQMAWDYAGKMGLHVQFDRTTPVAPYGTMFWFRPEALLKMSEYPWQHSDYPPEPGHNDGGLAHVQERLLGYTVMDAGYYVRSVINRDWAAINYAFLEYKLQRISSMLPNYTQDQVDYIAELQRQAPLMQQIKDEFSGKFPGLSRVVKPGYKALRKGYRAGRALRRS